jgi:hypothetical protein
MDWLLQFFCSHPLSIIKTDGNRLYTECWKCGKTSPGVLTGKIPAAVPDFRGITESEVRVLATSKRGPIC